MTCDASDTSLTKTVVITIANKPPVAIDDTGITTDEDASLLIDVLANDTDFDGPSLIVTAVSDPGHGTATIESGQVRYAPDPTTTVPTRSPTRSRTVMVGRYGHRQHHRDIGQR